MRKRIIGKLWYPKYYTPRGSKIKATPLVSGRIRVDGCVFTIDEAREMGVDPETILIAESFRERITKEL
jgi:hypothetical protein